MYKKFLKWVRGVVNFYPAIHFSQDGEDIALAEVFSGKSDGFYVDVGAFHPSRYSNTYKFYLSGWRGINIDARPDSMRAFRFWRRRDINIEAAISETPTELVYHLTSQPAMNSFDAALTQQRLEKDSSLQLLGKKTIETKRLDALLEAHLPAGQPIDFLSIDAEGYDLQVLKSNDWSRFSPRLVLVEIYCDSLAEVASSDIAVYLKNIGYQPVLKLTRTVIFQEAPKPS